MGKFKKLDHRGFFGIGIYHSKNGLNLGTLWRSAFIYGASFIFTIDKRYSGQASDTTKSIRHIPLWHFKDVNDFIDHIPYGCQPVCVENTEDSTILKSFNHPQRAVYILGAEDYGLPSQLLDDYEIVRIESEKDFCLNVSIAGSILLYDRFIKAGL